MRTFATGFCFLSGCGLTMRMCGTAAVSNLLPLCTDHSWGKLVHDRSSGIVTKPIRSQFCSAIYNPVIWEHDPLSLRYVVTRVIVL